MIDGLAHLVGGRLNRLPEHDVMLGKLVVQPSVADGNSGMMGEGVHTLRVLRGEASGRIAVGVEEADHLVFNHDRRANVGAYPPGLRQGGPLIRVGGISEKKQLFRFEHPAQTGHCRDIDPLGVEPANHVLLVTPRLDDVRPIPLDEHDVRRIVRDDAVEVREDEVKQLVEVERAVEGGGGVAQRFGEDVLLTLVLLDLFAGGDVA